MLARAVTASRLPFLICASCFLRPIDSSINMADSLDGTSLQVCVEEERKEPPPLPAVVDEKDAVRRAELAAAALVAKNPDRVITLVAEHGLGRFPVSIREASISGLVVTTLTHDRDEDELPISIKAPTLALVVKFMQYHKGKDAIPPDQPLRSSKMIDVCRDKWDAEFLDGISAPDREHTAEENQVVYDLAIAANYLDIHGLLRLVCAKVATWIKGASIEKVRDVLAGGLGLSNKRPAPETTSRGEDSEPPASKQSRSAEGDEEDT